MFATSWALNVDKKPDCMVRLASASIKALSWIPRVAYAQAVSATSWELNVGKKPAFYQHSKREFLYRS